MEKPFYTTGDRDYRIFNVQGSFDSLVEIRKDYDTVLTPTDADVKENDPRFKVLSSNIPTNVRSDEGQILSLLSRLLESYTERRSKGRFSESELVKKVGGILVFTSSNSKGGQPVRGISEMKRYNLFDEIYSYLKPVEYEVREGSQSAKKEYRVGQFVESLSSVQPDLGTGDKLNRSVGEFSRGILNENSSQIESGLFGVAKPVINQTATTSTSTINILGGRKYLFMSLRNMTELTQEEIEALSSVGSSLGGIFDTRDDVSVLISLKNANNAEQFLGALEKAGMEGMKKSMVRGESIESYNLVRNDDLEQTIKTFADADKFQQAKNVLVSHASLSALYNNVKSNSEGDQE